VGGLDICFGWWAGGLDIYFLGWWVGGLDTYIYIYTYIYMNIYIYIEIYICTHKILFSTISFISCRTMGT